MNIVFLDWPCFGKQSAIAAFTALGHSIRPFIHPEYKDWRSQAFDAALDVFLSSGSYDCFFSFNYYPGVAEVCKRHRLPYISVIYDSPHVALYSYTIVYPCNYVFLFDQTQYEELRRLGIPTVYYLPLPGDPERMDQLLAQSHDPSMYETDLSFVGSLYNEDHNLFDRLTGLSDYTKGYLDAIMQAQLNVYGQYFIEEILTPSVLEEMKASMPYEAGYSGIQTPEYIYGNYFLGRKITELDRIRTLTAVASQHPLTLYTLNQGFTRPGITNRGTIDYDRDMPYLFHYSKINLNITLRSIKSGIPLRAIDIMSAGGFLLTNYQADFLSFFVPDEDFVYYEDLEDLNRKITYYLEHEEERQQIARNGQNKIRQAHTFLLRFQEIITFVFANLERSDLHYE